MVKKIVNPCNCFCGNASSGLHNLPQKKLHNVTIFFVACIYCKKKIHILQHTRLAADGSWQLVVGGGCRLPVAGWWRLAFGGPRRLSFTKKMKVLKYSPANHCQPSAILAHLAEVQLIEEKNKEVSHF